MDNSSFKSDKHLWESYQNAIYRVYDPPFVFKIGHSSPSLIALLANNQCATFAYITAYNPNGIKVDRSKNFQANIYLKKDIEGVYLYYEGIGESEDISWEGEVSFLILGISLSDALTLKAKYEQKAIVFGGRDGIAELV